MNQSFEYMSNLQYEVKYLRALVKAFQSGEQYVRMEEEHRRIVADRDREIRRLKAELAAAHAETVDVRSKWFQTCADVVKEKETALAGKDREVKETREAMYQAQRQRDEALEKLRQRTRELYEVKTQLDDAQGKILGLTARVNRDYTNSSKPSSQSPNHKKIHNSRAASGRRPGGQPGHPHHGRKRQEPTRVVEIPAPEELAKSEEYRPTGSCVRRQLVLLHVKTEVIEYITPEFINKRTGRKAHARFPAGIKDDVNYDGTVKAAAYLLNNECNVSIGKTRKFLDTVTEGKVSLSDGMICGLSGEFSEKTREERGRIFLELLASPYLHTDFTFGRVNGKQGAVIICRYGDKVLYQGREKKGHEGVKGSPAELYQGTIISDHESTFQNYGARHQECLVHVERYLRASMENEPGLAWNKEMLGWIRETIHYVNSLGAGQTADQGKVEDFIEQYRRILARGKSEYEYEPPSRYFRDGYNLCKRMAENEDDYLLFLRDTSIPPTNNAAENGARKYKRKNAQAMCFRSEKGRDYYCDGLSVTESMKGAGEDLYAGVTRRFNQKQVKIK